MSGELIKCNYCAFTSVKLNSKLRIISDLGQAFVEKFVVQLKLD